MDKVRWAVPQPLFNIGVIGFAIFIRRPNIADYISENNTIPEA
jgi:hypothetical protein